MSLLQQCPSTIQMKINIAQTRKCRARKSYTWASDVVLCFLVLAFIDAEQRLAGCSSVDMMRELPVWTGNSCYIQPGSIDGKVMFSDTCAY